MWKLVTDADSVQRIWRYYIICTIDGGRVSSSWACILNKYVPMTHNRRNTSHDVVYASCTNTNFCWYNDSIRLTALRLQAPTMRRTGFEDNFVYGGVCNKYHKHMHVCMCWAASTNHTGDTPWLYNNADVYDLHKLNYKLILGMHWCNIKLTCFHFMLL